MANTSLHWGFRSVLHHFRQDGTLAVYLCYLLHANMRNRAWPSVELLIKETGWSRASVVAAKQWLVEHRALEKVGMAQRLGADETRTHQRTDIMQITGVLLIDGEVVPLLYFNQNTNDSLNISVDESMDTKSMVAETEVVSTPKGISINKGRKQYRRNVEPHKLDVNERYKGW